MVLYSDRLYDHDGGTILYKGQPVHFKNAMQAREAGIAIIHQEFNLFPNLTVAENIFLGDKSTQVHGLVNWAAMYRRAQELVDSIGGNFFCAGKSTGPLCARPAGGRNCESAGR